MKMEDNKTEQFSGEVQVQEKQPSNCNQKINRYIPFPTLTIEKIIKIIVAIGGTAFMIVAFFTGMAYSRHNIDCMMDMPYHYTERVHKYFYEHEKFALAIKFIISFMIDLLIIYTLIVWSLFGTNIRLITSGFTYIIVNLLCRFIHIQIQPEQSAFTQSHIFSFFVNYQVSTYSFFSVTIGIFVICALEWRRNNVRYMFWTMFGILILYVMFLIFMRGNYAHEIFTAGIFGHYFFMMNEKVLELIFGKEYVKGVDPNLEIPIDISSPKEEKKNEDLISNNQDYETGDEDNTNTNNNTNNTNNNQNNTDNQNNNDNQNKNDNQN